MYWDNGKEHGNYYSILGLCIGITEKKMETIIVYWGYFGLYYAGQCSIPWGNIGRMEKNMETTIMGYIGL